MTELFQSVYVGDIHVVVITGCVDCLSGESRSLRQAIGAKQTQSQNPVSSITFFVDCDCLAGKLNRPVVFSSSHHQHRLGHQCFR